MTSASWISSFCQQLSKRLEINDIRDLNVLVKSFTPTTIGQQLDLMAAKLSLSVDLDDISQVQALKLSLSYCIDLVNGKVTRIYIEHIDHHSWEKMTAANVTMCSGMTTASKQLYADIITKGTKNNKIDRIELRIAIAKAKVSAQESDQTEQQPSTRYHGHLRQALFLRRGLSTKLQRK